MSDEQITLEQAQEHIEALKKQIEELTAKQDEYLNGWKRAQADYVNFKNEQEKHSKELAQFAGMSLVIQFIPLLEHFRNAFLQVPEELKNSEWVKGIQHIQNQMKEALKLLGLEEYNDSVGKPFDPNLHQAVGQEARTDFDDDIVSQEISLGYRYHGRVISPAKVIVNKKSDTNQTCPIEPEKSETDDKENNS